MILIGFQIFKRLLTLRLYNFTLAFHYSYLLNKVKLLSSQEVIIITSYINYYIFKFFKVTITSRNILLFTYKLTKKVIFY